MSFFNKEDAEKAGNKILRKLKGDGWRLRVHANAGWHVSLVKGPMILHEMEVTNKREYFCLISDDVKHPRGGLMHWTGPKNSFKDPRRAVEYAINCVKRAVRKHVRVTEACII